MAFALKGRGVDGIVFVNDPSIPLARERVVVREAVERPDTIGILPLATREDDQRPRCAPLIKLLFAIDRVRDAEGPEIRAGISQR